MGGAGAGAGIAKAAGSKARARGRMTCEIMLFALRLEIDLGRDLCLDGNAWRSLRGLSFNGGWSDQNEVGEQKQSHTLTRAHTDTRKKEKEGRKGGKASEKDVAKDDGEGEDYKDARDALKLGGLVCCSSYLPR